MVRAHHMAGPICQHSVHLSGGGGSRGICSGWVSSSRFASSGLLNMGVSRGRNADFSSSESFLELQMAWFLSGWQGESYGVPRCPQSLRLWSQAVGDRPLRTESRLKSLCLWAWLHWSESTVARITGVWVESMVQDQYQGLGLCPVDRWMWGWSQMSKTISPTLNPFQHSK